MPIRLIIAALAAATLACAAQAQDSTKNWRALTDRDIDFMADLARDQAIGAVHPNPARFGATIAAARSRGHREATGVRDAAGQRAVLQHFVGAFHDAHLGLRVADPAQQAAWPGFVLRYQAGAYRVVSSQQPDAPNGEVLTSCDGKNAQALIDRFAEYEIGLPPTLDAVRVNAAAQLLVDRRNPFLKPPAQCVIGGRKVALTWRAAPMTTLNAAMQAARSKRDAELSIRPFGENGAWVRLGIFQPNTAAQAAAYHKLIADLPAIRDRDVIVFDVRGNGGGPYNWFMAVLRGLYGQPYADHYAVARLQIANVYRATPEIIRRERESDARSESFGEPDDPPRRTSGNTLDGMLAAQAAGKPYYAAPRPVLDIGPTTPSPVRGKVFVLTDSGCGSACIGFVDELKLFPGVQQIGRPTTVDSRTGTAYDFPLPSGFGGIRVPSMTRDGRPRGDNIDQVPDVRFDGDINDTAAVEAWINDVVLKTGSPR